jgi:hypothetical protein
MESTTRTTHARSSSVRTYPALPAVARAAFPGLVRRFAGRFAGPFVSRGTCSRFFFFPVLPSFRRVSLFRVKRNYHLLSVSVRDTGQSRPPGAEVPGGRLVLTTVCARAACTCMDENASNARRRTRGTCTTAPHFPLRPGGRPDFGPRGPLGRAPGGDGGWPPPPGTARQWPRPSCSARPSRACSRSR